MDRQRETFYSQVLSDLDEFRKQPVNAKYILPFWKALEAIPRAEMRNYLAVELIRRAKNPQYWDRDGQVFQECRALWYIFLNQLGFARHIRYVEELSEELARTESKITKTRHA